MTDATEWQGKVGQAWAEEWRRTDRSFTHLTERLLQEQRGATITQALDIGCGAGEVSLAIARANPSANITGIDISTDLIGAARGRANNLTNTEFLVTDAAVWRPQSGARPDFLTSRHGVMFFGDPEAAFSNLLAGAQEGAKLSFSCFRSASENGWIDELGKVLPGQQPKAEGYVPGPFAFGDRALVESILSESGWSGVTLEAFDYPMIFGLGVDAVSEAVLFFSRIGPLARYLKEAEEDAREKVLGALEKLASERLSDAIVAMPASAWIVTAQA